MPVAGSFTRVTGKESADFAAASDAFFHYRGFPHD